MKHQTATASLAVRGAADVLPLEQFGGAADALSPQAYASSPHSPRNAEVVVPGRPFGEQLDQQPERKVATHSDAEEPAIISTKCRNAGPRSAVPHRSAMRSSVTSRGRPRLRG